MYSTDDHDNPSISVCGNFVAKHSNHMLKYIAFLQLSSKMLLCYCCTILIGILANFGQQRGASKDCTYLQLGSTL